ncbi:MAG TPA: asparagine synthase (glutamine-hydrolyzing) [Gaiellaceae bacterium]|jgi:asparagine synthase (glutamine-hydrolysing)|nr:asparagine synthase (glutamine-hydrolyzing) [Gaiellaceae bacterium]
MCGICGVVEHGEAAEAATVTAMRDALAHRGPDGAGLFEARGVALGARRLAIIDPVPAGDQPVASEDGRVQLVHNGELYNYRELRAELAGGGHRFRTGTDTEVILAAYLEWGERCVERFLGMWAFALWDAREERLFCSRDRFGIKPFYYRRNGPRLAFASELKAFRSDPRTPLVANRAIVRDFLGRDLFDHSSETFFEGILRLPPAHNLVFDRAGLRLDRYWRLELPEHPPADPAGELRELLVDSIRMHLRSDVPIGTLLSGGMDSSSIACVVDLLQQTDAVEAAPVGERQQTFTVFFDGTRFDERPWARAVVDRTRAEAHWITFGAEDLVADLPAIVESQDEPFRSTSVCASWYLMREASRAGFKVVLGGQGGDEALAGYDAFFPARYRDLAASGRLGALARELRAHASVHGPRHARSIVRQALVPPGAEQALIARRSGSRGLVHVELAALPAIRQKAFSRFPDRVRNLQLRMLEGHGLAGLLHADDRSSMAHSLEARLPFLDHRLVELCLGLDGSSLIQEGVTKRVLRQALGDVLPPSVSGRTEKLGFETPERAWFRGPLGELAADVLSSRAARERGFVDTAAALERLERHRRGEVEGGRELWRALSVELWAIGFLDEDSARSHARGYDHP